MSLASLANYTDLVDAVSTAGGWLHRTDNATIVPVCIQMAEVSINYGLPDPNPLLNIEPLRVLEMETAYSGTTTAGTVTVALPTNFLEWRKLYITYNGIRRELRQRSAIPMSLSERSILQAIPERYWIQGSSMYLDPIPDAAYTLTGDYYLKVPALTSAATTNWLLTAAPMVYLAGTILHGSLWFGTKFDQTKWAKAFKVSMDQVSQNDIRKRGFGNVTTPVDCAFISRGRFNIRTGM